MKWEVIYFSMKVTCFTDDETSRQLAQSSVLWDVFQPTFSPAIQPPIHPHQHWITSCQSSSLSYFVKRNFLRCNLTGTWSSQLGLLLNVAFEIVNFQWMLVDKSKWMSIVYALKFFEFIQLVHSEMFIEKVFWKLTFLLESHFASSA